MIYNINNRDVDLNPLDVIFIKPGDVRKRYATNEPVDYVSFNFITDYKDALNVLTPDSTLINMKPESNNLDKSVLALQLNMEHIVNNDIKLLILALDSINKDLDSHDEMKTLLILATILQILKTKMATKVHNPTVLQIKQFLF